MVTPFEDEAWINWLLPVQIPECVIKRFVLYVLTKKTNPEGDVGFISYIYLFSIYLFSNDFDQQSNIKP
jgi:hypothetical protein